MEILASSDEAAAHADRWQALEIQCSDANAAFQGWSWCSPWMSLYCDDSTCKPHICLIHKHGELVALLPLMVEKIGGLRVLTILGDPHTQIANALTKSGVDCVAGLRLALLEHLPLADVVKLSPVVEGSALAFAIGADRLEPDPSEYMSLVTWRSTDTIDDYMGGISKNRRKDFRQKYRRLEQLGRVKFSRCRPSDQHFKGLIDQAIGLKREWLVRNGMVSVGLSKDHTRDFLSRLESNGSGFCPELDVLTVGEKLVAVTINLVGHHIEGGSIRHCYLSAYDEAYANASPGTLSHQLSIQATIEDGDRGYNFLGHPTHFKAMWANKYVALLRYQKANTLKGKLWLEVWSNRTRPMIKTAASKLKSTSQGRALAKVLLRGKSG